MGWEGLYYSGGRFANVVRVGAAFPIEGLALRDSDAGRDLSTFGDADWAWWGRWDAIQNAWGVWLYCDAPTTVIPAFAGIQRRNLLLR